jgi:glycosyltransferase involved in cell wall biosynthesis
LLTEEHTPLVNHPRYIPPLPADLPIELIRLTSHDHWSDAWMAIERFLEEQAPCIYVPVVDFRSTCITARLSSRVVVVATMMTDYRLEYEHVERLVRHWDAVVAVNSAIQRRAALWVPWLAANLVTIPICVPMPGDVPIRSAQGKLRLVYHGRLCQYQKRSLDFIDLLEQLEVRSVNFCLTLIGDGECRPALEKAATRFISDGRLVLSGTLPYEQTLEALRHQDVYILPSEFEGTPNALLEAMAYGCVPVVSDIETLTDIVAEGKTGFRCAIGDMQAFAAAVARLAADPVERVAMAERAATSVRQLGYDLETMIDRWQALFDRLETRTRHARYRPRGFMTAPPATFGGVSILPGEYSSFARLVNQVPLWPEPRTATRVSQHHRPHIAPLSEHRIILATTKGRISGVDVFAINLVQALLSRGLKAEILVTRPDEKVPDPMPFPDHIPVRTLAVEPGSSWQKRWALLRRTLIEHSPCIYIPNYDWYHSGICGTLPATVKVIGIAHSDDPAHYAHCLKLGSTWNGIVAVSKVVANHIRDLAPELADRLYTIPYGVGLPSSPISTVRSPHAPLRLLYAGRLIRYQKRVFDLLCILDALATRNVSVELTVVGSGPEEREFLQSSAQSLVSGRMRFMGGMANHHVQTLMAQADIFLLPSAFEGLPVSLLEAMAHGTIPVVTHSRSGVDEVIRHGENGFLVAVGDIDAFANYITHLSENPQQMAQMAQAARQTIETGGFTIHAMTESYLHLMEQIVSQPFSRPVTGILPPEDIRGWRSWLPPELPSPTVAVQSLRKRVELILKGLGSYF